ncbi:alpha-galactosidase isoform X2 [Selaginella moellendorffii]|nr:alpha-galactosidase isoform X2 [Selaginella moellendorffii]|eukprot:XP_002965742.2 alpha-galactosidase isoform X2 [Selaginella moellendorffii]
MRNRSSIFVRSMVAYWCWIVGAASGIAVRVIGAKRLQWISKRVPMEYLFWRNLGIVAAVAIFAWKARGRLGCSQLFDRTHTKWDIRKAVPLERRMVYDNGLGQTPLMGWSGWNFYECTINEKIVYGNMDALVRLDLPSYGYNYVIVDDCWSAYKRDKEGNLRSDKKTFPSGMKALADYAHERGMKFGLYSDAGRMTCKCHRAASEGHEFRDARTFASWGIDYLKYDNCFHKKNRPSHARYPVMSEALNKSGRPIFYAMCEWGEDHPAVWAGKYANSWRTSLDVKDRWPRIELLADDNNLWASYAGPGGWNDPDMLQVGNGRMSLAEYRSHFSIWSIMKAPLIIGCELRTITKEHLEIYKNTEIIAVNQDSLGIQGRKVSRIGQSEVITSCLTLTKLCVTTQVWAGPLSGDRIVMAAWNRGWKRALITINWYDIGLEPSVTASVRDLWKHEDWTQRQKDGFEVEIDSHDCGVYILSNISMVELYFNSGR